MCNFFFAKKDLLGDWISPFEVIVVAMKTNWYSALGEGTSPQGGARQSVDKSLNLP